MRIRYVYLAPIMVCALFLSCAPRSEEPKSPPAGEAAAAADSFVGSWRLVSWSRTSEDGDRIHSYGEDAFGRIIYLPNGRMAAILMRQGRPELSSDRLTDLTTDERAVLGEGFFAYTGSYAFDHVKGTVTHRVEACTNSNWVGAERVRTFELVGEDEILLRPIDTTLPTELVWRRER